MVALRQWWSTLRQTDVRDLEPRKRFAARLSVTVLATIAAGSAFGSNWSQSHRLIWNESNSLPDRIFYADSTIPLTRGGYIAFVPRRDAIVVAHFGKAPVPFVKRIYGVAGDVVSHDAGHYVVVNGTRIARLKPFTYFHEALLPGPVGRVPPGCYFAGSPHPDGFDSRYQSIGWVCQKDILGGARALL